MNRKRKVCIIVNSRANYARIKSLLAEIKNSKLLDLKLIVGASALLYRFGKVIDLIRRDGFKPEAVMHSFLEGETPETMAKSTGLSVVELATHFNNIKPDIVLTVADRYETMATAIAASYMNICLAHTQGGESTGSIDESVRHAITKLSHLHFPSTKKSKENIIKMGENKKYVWNTGCPSLDLIKDDLKIQKNFWKTHGGTGFEVDLYDKYIVVLQHPVTTEYDQAYNQMSISLKAIKSLNIPVILLWPNSDAGSDQVSKSIREFKENNRDFPLRLVRHLPTEEYIKLIYNSVCLVGNSSSAIREGAYLGVPAVNIGTRQINRESCQNIIHTDHSEVKIKQAILKQIKHGRYKTSKLYGDGKSARRIMKILSTVDLNINKSLSYVK